MLGQIVTCYAVHRSFDRIQIFPLRMTVRVHVCTSARAKPANCARARILIMKFLPPSCDSASFELRLRVLRLAVIAYRLRAAGRRRSVLAVPVVLDGIVHLVLERALGLGEGVEDEDGIAAPLAPLPRKHTQHRRREEWQHAQ